ncbi:MAG: S-layer homology domain-containing protein [Oscillospiraceae bacterium]|nr:S-layer homology domain-containing protein [Oscillospiraceae bacterium]
MPRIKNLIISFILISVMVIPVKAQGVRSVNELEDVPPDAWYYPYVKKLYEDYLINGVGENIFAPDQNVTAAELAAMITRYLGLENTARQRHGLLAANNTAGHDLWYSGYIQVLYELYILDETYLEQFALRVTSSGQIAISSSAARLIEAPVKRMDMARMIAGSFEMRRSNSLKSRRPLPGELSGSGGEFITGGGYDRELLNYISSNKIADHSDIPLGYRTPFLKLIYNGIIGGNELGQVMPQSYLRRSELARIIASVVYFDMRDADLRRLPAACEIQPGDYAVSSVDGSKFLKQDAAARILREQAKNITASLQPGGRININIEQQNIIPAGFINEIYIYTLDSGTALEAGRMTGASARSEFLPRVNSFTVFGSAEAAGYVYLILRDLTRNGEVAGAIMLNVGSDGRLRESDVYNLP